MNFKGCKLELRLSPQSPLIHFQPEDAGATLRASEMKPKLDKFLIKQFKREGINYKNWVRKENDNTKAEALDYKVRIRTEKPSCKVDIGRGENRRNGITEQYSIYYGNMGDGSKKTGIISYPVITIMCFREDLQEQIVKHIEAFFWLTNFGTMQSKGFGGFIVEGSAAVEDNLLKSFKDNGVKAVCKMDFGQLPISNPSNPDYQTSVEMFRNIKRFYSVMKSGLNLYFNNNGYARSYIFRYMHDRLQIDNEKAWMKEERISPVLETNRVRYEYQKNPKPRYVRAMFGKGDQIRYKEEGGRGFVNVSITPSSVQKKKLERIPSIILFKVIGQYIYILGHSVPDEVYDQKFDFKGIGGKAKSLTTPSHADFSATGGEFPIKDFLDKYVEYYNNGCRTDLKDMGKFKKVVKCK